LPASGARRREKQDSTAQHPVPTEPNVAAVKKTYVDAGGLQIHGRVSGGRGPHVFLFHETALSSRIFERVFPILGHDCRAIAFDTPGYGLSDPLPGPPTVTGYAERLASAMGHFLEPGETCALVGVHTGAAIAIALMAVNLVGRVSHAVLCGVPLFTAQEIARYRQIMHQPRIQADGRHLAEARTNRRRLWGEDTDLELMHLGLTEQMLVYRRHHDGHDAVFAEDIGRWLPLISCPVLLLNGERDSLAANDRRALPLIAGASLKIVAGVGGQLAYRRPEFFAGELRRFRGFADQRK
jgi:pimeloyl-ACP methyl ester carboxylesterase